MTSLRRILAVFFGLNIGLLSLTAQDSLLYRRFSINDTVCSLESALKIIENKTGLSFSYNSGLIDKKKTSYLKSNKEDLTHVLNRLFNDPTLSFSVIGRHLVVYRSVKTRTADPSRGTDTVLYFEIRGRVFDKETQQPLTYATISLVGKTIGTISNDEGVFQLKLNSADIAQAVNISCVGYKSFTAPVSTLINTNKDYYLKEDIIPIQEVIIRKINPVALLKSANEKLKINYPQKPVVLTSFYRETVQRGSRYMMVSEALLKNYKTSYLSDASDQMKIIKGRKSENFGRSDTVVLKLKAGLNTMIQLDVVKNMPDFLTGENLDLYTYKLADLVNQDGKEYYVVAFSPAPGAANTFFSGRILISLQDMAFKWVDFHVDPEKLDEATKFFVVRKPVSMKVKVLDAGYKVAFKKTGNKYYLQLVECEMQFKIRTRKQLTGTVYKTDIEMAVTTLDTLNVERFPAKETARTNEFFSDQLGTYDEAFWGEFNFIKPGESLENAIVKLTKAEMLKREEEEKAGSKN
jgi:hypothetical protein